MPARRCLPALAAAALSLAGCASLPEDGAPAPEDVPDISAIQEPEPRPEPRSERGNPASYTVDGRTYRVLDSHHGYVTEGVASWYGTKFHGRTTSSGEPYDMYAMTAAHKTLPIPSYVRVTNLDNGRSVVVRVNDRGPFAKGRVIDLSYAAAVKLGMARRGTAPVRVEALSPGRADGPDRPSVPVGPERPVYLQVGAFSERGNAERLRGRLERRLSPNRVTIRRAAGDGSAVFRVHVGPATSTAELEHLRRTVDGLGLSALHVMAAEAGVDAPR